MHFQVVLYAHDCSCTCYIIILNLLYRFNLLYVSVYCSTLYCLAIVLPCAACVLRHLENHINFSKILLKIINGRLCKDNRFEILLA